MSEYVLRTKNLCKSYGNKMVLTDVNMDIRKGEIYGFIGNNGAGKTTLMRIICNLASVTKGNIELFGKTGTRAGVHIGSMIEYPALYGNLTAIQNLEIQKRNIGAKGDGQIMKILKTVGLENTENKTVKSFSLGMRQRLGLALALLNDPDFLVLDEPINGLDPTGITEIREILTKLNKERNITILISSHILSELYLLASAYGIIDNGRLIKQISDAELKNECKHYIKLVTKNVPLAITTLKTFLSPDCFIVDKNNIIRIFQYTDDPNYIIRTLVTADVDIQGVSVVGQDLEEYYLSLIGGNLHD